MTTNKGLSEDSHYPQTIYTFAYIKNGKESFIVKRSEEEASSFIEMCIKDDAITQIILMYSTITRLK